MTEKSYWGGADAAKEHELTKMKEEPPYIKGEAQILDEEGNVIGYETVAYYNPKYNLFKHCRETDENVSCSLKSQSE